MEPSQNRDQYSQGHKQTTQEHADKKKNTWIAVALVLGLAIAAFAIFKGMHARNESNESGDQTPAAGASANDNDMRNDDNAVRDANGVNNPNAANPDSVDANKNANPNAPAPAADDSLGSVRNTGPADNSRPDVKP